MIPAKPKILIVDDERFFINILVNLLNAEYRTAIALNGEQAIDRTLSDSPPDLILLDIVMPGMDGYEVCKRLKQNPKSRDIPIIFLTGRSEVDDETKGFQLGAIDYITKPISPPIVKARVSTQLILEQTREALKKTNRELEATVAERTKDLTQEILDRKSIEEQLYRLANYDPLTSLPNRMNFEEQLTQLIATARTNNAKVVLMLLDIAHFKHLNNTLGYGHGDELLKQMANRFLDCIPEANSIARFGNDKFAIAVLESQGGNTVEHVTANIATAFKGPFRLDSSDYTAKLRIGIAKLPVDAKDLNGLIGNTLLALSQARTDHSANIVYYTPTLSQRTAEQAKLAKELSQAIEQDQLVLHFQPILATSNRALLGAEALVRWRHPQRGLLLPDEFIPIAEQTDLILKLGEWILYRACEAAQTWTTTATDSLEVAVNISSRQCYYSMHCLSTIFRILQQTQLAANRLCLEISENVFIDAPPESLEELNQVRKLGVRIAISKFGIGYSSMSFVRTFPVDVLNIDRSIIAETTDDNPDTALIFAILSMTKALDLKVTAKGVENENQLAILQSGDCDSVQGFLFSEPLDAEQFKDFILYYRPSTS